MSFTKEEALAKARKDLARRLHVDPAQIGEGTVDEADFPDMALGAPTEDEMSGQMITRGWRIHLQAKGETFEYRADKNQVRLYDFQGENFRV